MQGRTFVMALAAAGLAACARDTATIDPQDLAAFTPLPARLETPANPMTTAKVDLGRMLYYDTRLSANENVSCNSCHNLDTYGVDGRPRSLGTASTLGGRNSPTVLNAAGHVAQFWDGRAPTIEEQAKGPILNPVEMGMANDVAVLARLRAVPAYQAAFRAAFPGEREPVTYDNLGRAIGAFERGLVTPAAWDRLLAGEDSALTPEQRRGFTAFVAVGCASCHSGQLLGGSMFQKLGLVQAWRDTSDIGRAAVTHAPGDTLVFKVPSLRNVERTGPYFHDGSVPTLDEAVVLMARHQLGRELSQTERTRIVAFLSSLTGAVDRAYAARRVSE